jgi:hypothetical protein
MSYLRSTEMNTMPKLMSPRLSGAYARIARKASWRHVGDRISGRHGSDWGEELL